MQVSAISNQAFTARIPSKINVEQKLQPERIYLYNEVSDLIKKHQKPAIITNKGIEISSLTEEFIKILKNLGIKFTELD